MANRHISISMPVRVARDSKKKGQQGSKRAKCSIKSKSPQRKCKIRERRSKNRNGNSIIQTGAGGVANGVVHASVSYSVPGSSRYALSGMAKPWLRQRSVHTLQFICTYLLLLLPTSPSLSHSPLRVMRLRYLHLVLLINQFDLLN